MGKISTAGVLRLRAIKLSVCDRSAKRFAQDDAFVAGLKYSWLDMQKHEKIEKVTGSRDDKERATVHREWLLTEAFLIDLGGPQAQESSGRDDKFVRTRRIVISTGAEWRDLRFPLRQLK